MPTFPLESRPALDYRGPGRRFGASRDGGSRLHAGCDLIAPDGTAVYSVAGQGTVVQGPYPFHHGAFAIEIRYPSFTVRYCEIRGVPGVSVGTAVHEGQLIAYIQRMERDAMLHFEMYGNTVAGPLTQRSNRPYERRADLVDPTNFLDGCSPMWQTTEFLTED